MTETIYQVAPRYTGGSPAQVNHATASRVAAEEADAYRGIMAGAATSTSERQRAVKLGLDGIAEMLYEQQHCWHVTDLITGKETTRPFEHQKQEPAPMSPKERMVRDLCVLARCLKLAEDAIDCYLATAGEDPGLGYLKMDVHSLTDRVTYLADQREMGRA